ncbi:hypothetical protein D3C86_1684900 [compost metagenome]
MAPAPPSLVALPPIARITRCAPASSAARINCPVPKVLLMHASRCATGTNCKPLASAISMIAVWLWGNQPQAASTVAPSGPRTKVRRCWPSHAARIDSTVPSPPSAIGHLISWASGQTCANPNAMASATPWALRLSLNESGAITIFMGILQFQCPHAASRHEQ